MSDNKRSKTKRAAAAPQIVEKTAQAPKPVEAVPPKPVPVALAKPFEATPKPIAVAPPKPVEAARPKPVAVTQPKPIEAPPPKPIETAPPKSVEVLPPEPIKVALAEASAPMPEPKVALPVPMPAPPRSSERWFAAYSATLASISESHAAIASDAAALSLEMTGLTQSYLTAAGDSVVAFFTARSLVDAVEAQLGFARRSIDMLGGGSNRLGELGLRLADDVAKPVFHSFAAG
ncbi:MAG TPA: phasin family protein [Stellaceae bacterium]|jgi:hypothetical protein|nr:phasin family protein [Stellaceae bacterium]